MGGLEGVGDGGEIEISPMGVHFQFQEIIFVIYTILRVGKNVFTTYTICKWFHKYFSQFYNITKEEYCLHSLTKPHKAILFFLDAYHNLKIYLAKKYIKQPGQNHCKYIINK